MKILKLKQAAIVILAISVVLSACTVRDPYSGEVKYSSTTKGMFYGTLLGAAAGQAIGLDSEATLTGAAAGLFLGTSIGAYMGDNFEEMKTATKSTGMQVRQNGHNITLTMPNNITFDTNSSMIKPEFFNSLSNVAAILNKYDKTYVEIAGFTDNTGLSPYNVLLAKDRAISVANYLQRAGVDVSRMVVRAYGEQSPVASNGSVIGRSMNRRVELRIRPMQDQFGGGQVVNPVVNQFRAPAPVQEPVMTNQYMVPAPVMPTMATTPAVPGQYMVPAPVMPNQYVLPSYNTTTTQYNQQYTNSMVGY